MQKTAQKHRPVNTTIAEVIHKRFDDTVKSMLLLV